MKTSRTVGHMRVAIQRRPVLGEAPRLARCAPGARTRLRAVEHDRPSLSQHDRAVRPHLPSPRGPISHEVVKALSRTPGSLRSPRVRTDDAVTDEDLQLALYC